MLCFLFAALIIALDQFFKQWVLRTLELGEIGPEIIPGVLGITRWENDGAMLNILSEQQWLLAGIAFAASIALIMILLRYSEGFWGTIGLASVLGGTVGNLIDRVFNEGKVVDMFKTLFIKFPIFNIADIFITLGFLTFLIHFIFLTVKAGKDSPTDLNAEFDVSDPQIQDSELDGGSFPDIESLVSSQVQHERPMSITPDISESSVTPQVYDVTPAPVAPAVPATPVAPQITSEPIAAPSVSSLTDDYRSLLGDYETTDATPEISYTMEALEAELGSIEIDIGDYDVDALLREYGLEDDDLNV